MARTYIVARAWRDYPPDIDVESLLKTGDRELALFLECQAAKWIRDNTARPTPGDGTKVAVFDWAQTVPDPDAQILARVPLRVQERLGLAWLVHVVVTGRYPEAPMWALVHGAPSRLDATAIVEATAIRMPNGPLVEVQIVEQSEALTTAQWLAWERTLEDFERRHRSPFDEQEWRSWPSHPLKRFRDEVDRCAHALALHRPVTAIDERTGAVDEVKHSTIAGVVATSVAAECDPNQLIQHTNTWELVFEGKRVLLPRLTGIEMIRMLLQRPNEPVSVEELLGDPPCHVDASSSEPQLDPEAFDSLRRRLEELEPELDEAEEHNNISRREELTSEKHELIEQIAAARGTAGRARQMTGGLRDRARVKAASRLETALLRVSQAHADCGHHLRESIVTPTGVAPCYRPRRATRWLFGGPGRP